MSVHDVHRLWHQTLANRGRSSLECRVLAIIVSEIVSGDSTADRVQFVDVSDAEVRKTVDNTILTGLGVLLQVLPENDRPQASVLFEKARVLLWK